MMCSYGTKKKKENKEKLNVEKVLQLKKYSKSLFKSL